MAVEGQAEIINAPAVGRGPLISKAAILHVKTIFALAAALAIGVGIIFWAMRPSFTPVFSHQVGIDALQITEVLKSENIMFEIDAKSGLVLVPEADLQRARMVLGGSGVAPGSAGGFEALRQEQPIGTSQFMEAARYHHVLETELARTVSAMRNIESARVHLAMPKQSVFVRKQAKASASVMVRLLPGRSLETGQVSAIVYLVSSSVPYMDASNVTVVDQWGRMLSAQGDNPDMALSKQHLDFTRKLEQDYVNRIEALLTPIVGFGRVKAQVNAEVDFSTDESVQEIYNPDATTVRSEQVEETQSRDGAGDGGVPGALANQPPADTALVEGEGVVAASAEPSRSSRSSTRNFEIDKTIRRVKQSHGTIQRLTIAVVIDNKIIPSEGKRKKKPETAPFTAEEIGRFTELVKRAVGFKEERGDSVEVLNSAFQAPEEIKAIPDEPIWKQSWLWSILKQVAAAAVVLFIIFGIVRPALRGVGATGGAEMDAASEGAAIGADGKFALSHQTLDGALPAPPQVYGDILNMAKAMAADDPKRVAKVIKDWVADDGG